MEWKKDLTTGKDNHSEQKECQKSKYNFVWQRVMYNRIHFNKTLICHKHDEHNLPLKISRSFVKVTPSELLLGK